MFPRKLSRLMDDAGIGEFTCRHIAEALRWGLRRLQVVGALSSFRTSNNKEVGCVFPLALASQALSFLLRPIAKLKSSPRRRRRLKCSRGSHWRAHLSLISTRRLSLNATRLTAAKGCSILNVGHPIPPGPGRTRTTTPHSLSWQMALSCLTPG